MISRKAMTKILCRNSDKSFLDCEKNGFKKHLTALFPREFFHVCIINKVIIRFFSFNLKLICIFKKQNYKIGSLIFTTTGIPQKDLRKACIFTCSCQHAAVNFSHMDTYGFQPHSPMIMRQPPPKTKGQANMEHIISALPSVSQVGATLSIMYDLTQRFEDEVNMTCLKLNRWRKW